MITISDIKKMIEDYANKHGDMPTKIQMTAFDYNCVRDECLGRIHIEIATADEVEKGGYMSRLCGMSVSIADKTTLSG